MRCLQKWSEIQPQCECVVNTKSRLFSFVCCPMLLFMSLCFVIFYFRFNSYFHSVVSPLSALQSCILFFFSCIVSSRIVFVFLSFSNVALFIMWSTLTCVVYEICWYNYLAFSRATVNSAELYIQTSSESCWTLVLAAQQRPPALKTSSASSSPKWNHTAGSCSCHSGKAPPGVGWLHYINANFFKNKN